MSVVLNGINQYLKRAVVLSITPMAFACWFKASDVDNVFPLMATDDGNDDIQLVQAAGTVEGDPVRIASYDAGGWAFADSTSGFSAGIWCHVCGLFSGISSRLIWLNGGSKGEDTTLKNPTEELYTWIGSYKNAATLFEGKIAEAAIWNWNLNDAEVLQLAQGAKPSAIRPAQLQSYWPLLNNPNDISGNNKHLDEYGSPTYSSDSPEAMIKKPTPPQILAPGNMESWNW